MFGPLLMSGVEATGGNQGEFFGTKQAAGGQGGGGGQTGDFSRHQQQTQQAYQQLTSMTKAMHDNRIRIIRGMT